MDHNITKESEGIVLYESKPWCTVKGTFVIEDCWIGCNWYCRHREIKSDEARIAIGEKPTKGYADGKWKNMPNFRCNVKVVVNEIPEYLKENNG